MRRLLAAQLGLLIVLADALGWLKLRSDGEPSAAPFDGNDAARVAHGAYPARAGNCQDCPRRAAQRLTPQGAASPRPSAPSTAAT